MGNLPCDVFRHMRLLFRGGSHLLAHAGDPVHRFTNALQRLLSLDDLSQSLRRFPVTHLGDRDRLASLGGQ